MAAPREGSKAPDFLLKDAAGKSHKLADYNGRLLVVYFYPRDNTPGCTIEAKEFSDCLGQFRKAGAEVVGISKDDTQSHQKFTDSCNLSVTLLSDPDSKTIKAYGAYGDKGIFGKGTIRSTFIINKNGNVAKIFPRVRALGHAKQVLQAINQLRAGQI